VAIAENLEAQSGTWSLSSNQLRKIARIRDCRPCGAHDDIAIADARAIRRAADVHIGDKGALRVRQAQRTG
jgi:hypothetical protein